MAKGTSVHASSQEQRALASQPSGMSAPSGVTDCDCANVLRGLGECRRALVGLSEAEHLAVLCTLAAEHGLTVRREPASPDSGGASPRRQAALGAPDDLDWAREFVSQVVLSDALMGAAMRLDESKQEIDTIAARLDRVAEGAVAPLEQAEGQYAHLFQHVNQGVFVCDAAGRFVDVNPAALELLGYGTKAALAAERTFGWLFADAASWEGFFATLAERGTIEQAECELTRRDGARVHALVTASLIRNSGGAVTGFEGIVFDVTERRRLHARLVEAQRLEAVRQIITTYSHEINPPLATLCNLVQQLLERSGPDAPEGHIVLAMSDEAAKLAEAMIKVGRLREALPKEKPAEAPGTSESPGTHP